MKQIQRLLNIINLATRGASWHGEAGYRHADLSLPSGYMKFTYEEIDRMHFDFVSHAKKDGGKSFVFSGYNNYGEFRAKLYETDRFATAVSATDIFFLNKSEQAEYILIPHGTEKFKAFADRLEDELLNLDSASCIDNFVRNENTWLFQTTNGCYMSCRHCMYSCKPGRNFPYIPKQAFINYIDQIAETTPHGSIIISGGDPFYADQTAGGNYLIPIIQHALNKRLSVALKSSWAWTRNNPEYLDQLRGLDFSSNARLAMHISIDDYHKKCVKYGADLIEHFYRNPSNDNQNISFFLCCLYNNKITSGSLTSELQARGIHRRHDGSDFHIDYGYAPTVKIGRAKKENLGTPAGELNFETNTTNGVNLFSYGNKQIAIFAPDKFSIGLETDNIRGGTNLLTADGHARPIKEMKMEIGKNIYNGLIRGFAADAAARRR